MTGNVSRKRLSARAVREDEFRRTCPDHEVMLSMGILDLASNIRDEIVGAIRSFDAFTRENDPHGTHDEGRLMVSGISICWYHDVRVEITPATAPSQRMNQEVAHRLKILTEAEKTSGGQIGFRPLAPKHDAVE